MKDLIFLIKKILKARPELDEYKLIFVNEAKSYYCDDFFTLCSKNDLILQLSNTAKHYIHVSDFLHFCSQIKQYNPTQNLNVYLSIDKKYDNREIILFKHKIDEKKKEFIIFIEVSPHTFIDETKNDNNHTPNNKKIDSGNDFFGFYD